jgi:hypothetical protein
MYRVVDQVRHANANGLDWMVIADHGNTTHAGIGTDKAYADIVAARADFKDTLVFHGLEWNVPSAEHGTVFVHPGPDEVAVLREFETAYDGEVRGAQGPGADNEALAVAGVNFLAAAVAQRRVQDALFIVNHPSRRGINSPRELRSWRDAQPHITIGFEGAPGHQPSGIAAPFGLAAARGLYDQTATVASFPAYPPESYRTWGGFDWMTATVGGLWDSMLAEGKAVVDHRVLRRPLGLRRHRHDGTGQRLHRQRSPERPRVRGSSSTRGRSTSGPASTAAPMWARPTSPTPRSWPDCERAGSGSTTAG